MVLDETYALLTTVVMFKRDKGLTPDELTNFMKYVERLQDPTWAHKLLAHLFEIFPDLKVPSTALGKAMLPHLAAYMIKYPGFKPPKADAADLARAASRREP